MHDVVIVEAVRTPIGRRNGALKDVHPAHLAAIVLREVVRRADVPPELVDDVLMGCLTQVGEQGVNIGRTATLLADFPIEVPATTLDRQCGSSQQAVAFAASQIASGNADVIIAAGVESMTRVPMGSNTAGPGSPFPPDLLEHYNLVPQGISAELVAQRWELGRAELDGYALRSHQRAARATDKGAFTREIVPFANGTTTVTSDEGIRRDTSLERLATLSTPFVSNGVITAGSSSQISDGAAAVLLMSAERARELGVRPRARVVAQATVGVDPVLMLTGPIPATRKVLARAGLTLDDIDLFEVNEAFASVVLAWQRELEPDMERVNVNGGAIALGHPLGASGARLLTTLLHELERREGRYGLQTMCCGGGLGVALIIERIG